MLLLLIAALLSQTSTSTCFCTLMTRDNTCYCTEPRGSAVLSVSRHVYAQADGGTRLEDWQCRNTDGGWSVVPGSITINGTFTTKPGETIYIVP